MWIIYKHTCIETGKYYIGQTVTDLVSRWNKHIKAAQNVKDKNYNTYFNKAIRKYGTENWNHQVIEQGLENKEDADEREIFWIALFCATNRKLGYNLRSGGARGRQSQETKDKISNANKGRKPSIQTIAASVKARRLLAVSEEYRQKISRAHRGKEPGNKITFTDEQIKSILADKRGYREICKDYGCSTMPIQRIKKQNNGVYK
jgi:group I intron endonuclease